MRPYEIMYKVGKYTNSILVEASGWFEAWEWANRLELIPEGAEILDVKLRS